MTGPLINVPDGTTAIETFLKVLLEHSPMLNEVEVRSLMHA